MRKYTNVPWQVVFDEVGLGVIGLALGVARTGSREICDPPPMDTDLDYVLLVENACAAHQALGPLGFVYSSEGYEAHERDDDAPFKCYRRGDLNLIVTPSEEFFHRWAAATAYARALGLDLKSDRIQLFTEVLYA